MENDKGVTADYSSFPIITEGGCGYRLNKSDNTHLRTCSSHWLSLCPLNLIDLLWYIGHNTS